jgi:hypothetical protein
MRLAKRGHLMRPTFFAAFAVASLLSSGCGTTLSTLQPAEPMKPGHIQANVATTVNVPASRIVAAVDVADDLARRYASDPGYTPTLEEQRRAVAAATGLGLSSPGPNNDLMLRVGVLKDFDAGIRWSGLAAHIDGKYRFLGGAPEAEGEAAKTFREEMGPEKDAGFQGAVSLGLSRSLYSGFVFDALDFLDVGGYSRWNLEIPVIFGKGLGNLGHVWFGPKYVFSSYSIDASLRNVGAASTTSGSIHHLGAFGGIAVGYKVVFFVAELTIMKMFAEPEIFGQKTDLGGIVVVPAGGLMLRL